MDHFHPETPFVLFCYLTCFVLAIFVQIQKARNMREDENLTINFKPTNQWIPNQESFFTTLLIVVAYCVTLFAVMAFNQ